MFLLVCFINACAGDDNFESSTNQSPAKEQNETEDIDLGYVNPHLEPYVEIPNELELYEEFNKESEDDEYNDEESYNDESVHEYSEEMAEVEEHDDENLSLRDSKRMYSPVFDGIFRFAARQSDGNVRLCYGSVIQRHLVITSAWCVHEISSQGWKKIHPNKFRINSGRYYRGIIPVRVLLPNSDSSGYKDFDYTLQSNPAPSGLALLMFRRNTFLPRHVYPVSRVANYNWVRPNNYMMLLGYEGTDFENQRYGFNIVSRIFGEHDFKKFIYVKRVKKNPDHPVGHFVIPELKEKGTPIFKVNLAKLGIPSTEYSKYPLVFNKLLRKIPSQIKLASTIVGVNGDILAFNHHDYTERRFQSINDLGSKQFLDHYFTPILRMKFKLPVEKIHKHLQGVSRVTVHISCGKQITYSAPNLPVSHLKILNANDPRKIKFAVNATGILASNSDRCSALIRNTHNMRQILYRSNLKDLDHSGRQDIGFYWRKP